MVIRPSLYLFGGKSEEQLQAQLDAPGNVALAAGVPEVCVCSIRLPGLIHRAEEHAIECVPHVGFEAHVLVFSEEGVFVDGKVFVEVLECANAGIHSWGVAELKRTRIGPATLIQVRIAVWIAEVP